MLQRLKIFKSIILPSTLTLTGEKPDVHVYIHILLILSSSLEPYTIIFQTV